MKLPIFLLPIFCFALITIQVATAQSKLNLNNLMLQAAINNQTDSVKYWLEQGADVNTLDMQEEYCTLLYAVKNANYDLIYWLLKNGANPNITNKFGVTPLMCAAQMGSLRYCYLLYSFGSKISIKDNNGKTAIEYSEDSGYLRVQLKNLI